MDTVFKEWKSNLLHSWDYVFIGYFIGFVVLVGGIGIYPSIYDYYSTEENKDLWIIFPNIMTYSIALSIPASVTILGSKSKDNRALSIYTVLLFVLLPIALCILEYTFRCYFFAIACLILSWIIWIIANHKNPLYHNKNFSEEIKKKSKKLSNGWS